MSNQLVRFSYISRGYSSGLVDDQPKQLLLTQTRDDLSGADPQVSSLRQVPSEGSCLQKFAEPVIEDISIFWSRTQQRTLNNMLTSL